MSENHSSADKKDKNGTPELSAEELRETERDLECGERDPNGMAPNEPGAKLDAGKPRTGLVFRGFARALQQVVNVGTYGARKYSPNGWLHVPDAIERYEDALDRHLLADKSGEELDPESGLPHLAHAAWNILALIELREREK